MRLSVLTLCAVLLEASWLAVWPLSVTLSHSPLFTAAMLETHPAVATLLAHARQVANGVLPGLSDLPLKDPFGSASYVAPSMALAAVMLWLVAVYAASLLALDRGLGKARWAPGVILGGALAFQATLLGSPGLFSQDVFSYIAYGRIAAVYELNPYVWPPSVLHDAIVPWVAEVWRTYASPYGPAWVNVQWLIGRLASWSGLSIVDQALLYRGLANLLLLANLGLVWRLLGRLTPLNTSQRTTALAALAWNPLLLFEIAGNAHNDALMVTLSLLGLLTFTHSSRGVVSSAAFTLSALVKYLSGLGLVWVALASAARAANWPGRLGRLVAIGVVAALVVVAMAAPWLELPDSLDPLLNETAGVGYVNALPDRLLVMALRLVGGPLDLARSIERLVLLSVFAAYLLWEVRQVWCDRNRGTVARALARSSLIYVLLVSTSVQTWYFCLPISIAVALGWRRRITRLTLAYSSLALPVLYVSYYLRETTPGWFYVAYACAPLLVLVPDVLKARRRQSDGGDLTEGAPERGQVLQGATQHLEV